MMRSWIISALCYSVIHVTGDTVPAPDTLPKECGKAELTAQHRIIGGNTTQPGEHPWLVLLYKMGKSGKQQLCGGCLITNRHVLTAAHCFDDGFNKILARDLLMHVGDYDSSTSDDLKPGITQTVKASEIISHKDFNPQTFLNDISIVVLEKEVQFGTYVQPVCLPYGELSNKDFENQELVVTGWGYTDPHGSPSKIPLKANIKTWDLMDCRERFYNKFKVNLTRLYLCAGDDGSGKVDACEGDSGGPLLAIHNLRYYEVGIVSFGDGCATKGMPGVYTRVTRQLTWITEQLAKTTANKTS